MASLLPSHYTSNSHHNQSSPTGSPQSAYPQPYHHQVQHGDLHQPPASYPLYNFTSAPANSYSQRQYDQSSAQPLIPLTFKGTPHLQLPQPSSQSQLHLEFPIQNHHYNPNRYYQLSAGDYTSSQLPYNYHNPVQGTRNGLHTPVPQSAPPGMQHVGQMHSGRLSAESRHSDSSSQDAQGGQVGSMSAGAAAPPSYLPSPGGDGHTHINTALLQPSPQPQNGAFLSPQYPPYGVPSSNEQDLRKVSDSLRDHSPNGMYAPHSMVPSSNVRGGSYGGEYGFETVQEEDDNPYEKERIANIMENQKLFDSLGLGMGKPSSFGPQHRITSRAPSVARRNISSRKHSSAYNKRELIAGDRVRASPRIASMHRNVSYADVEGQYQEYDEGSNSDEYDDREGSYEDEEEGDFRPRKRTKGNRRVSRTVSGPVQRRSTGPKPTLFNLLQTHPGLRNEFPLFYFALLPDLTVNPDAVPLIGSVPQTSTPVEKAAYLRAYFHRVRRLLAQLDAFTSRCERKHEGPGQRWPELDYFTRTAIRDVRRKAVERSENYKYTRRDLLNKAVGKNKWEPIEHGLIEWRIGMADKDPANDLDGIELIPPSPPHYQQYSKQHSESAGSVSPNPFHQEERVIRPMPSMCRMPSSSRSDSIATSPPDAMNGFHGQYAHHQPMPRLAPNYDMSQQTPVHMYGEDGTAMQMQVPSSAVTLAPDHTAWEGKRGVKRERSASDEEVAAQQEVAQAQEMPANEWVSPELEFGTV